MSLKIIRNDITKMTTDAVVNTANSEVSVGDGCDRAVYNAAGYDKLLNYRKEKIGKVSEGEVFYSPGFDLPCKFVIHAVSPLYIDGKHGEEEKLRNCYKKALDLAVSLGAQSLAFPLISTGSYGFPKEEGLRIALDEINAFLLKKDIDVFLTVFDEKSLQLGKKVSPKLEEYINDKYVSDASDEEYFESISLKTDGHISDELFFNRESTRLRAEKYLFDDDSSKKKKTGVLSKLLSGSKGSGKNESVSDFTGEPAVFGQKSSERSALPLANRCPEPEEDSEEGYYEFEEGISDAIKERMQHMTDTFSQYLMYLIENKKMANSDVYKRAVVDKKVFSKIKNDINWHPKKITALCLCVGAKLNLDETKDLLARAGYALSPCDKTDVIFSFFIENEIYDMIEIDIQLEEHGLECVID